MKPVWPSYGYSKITDAYFANELHQIIKDIENASVSDTDFINKYNTQGYSDEVKKKLHHARIAKTEHSLLHLAAKHNRKSLCEFIIQELKIDVNVLSKSKQTPLHYFISNNVLTKKECAPNGEPENEKQLAFKSTFELFISHHHCNINFQDENGSSLMHLAAIKNNYFATLCLLSLSNIKIDTQDENGLTPLHLACKFGSEDTALLLINSLDSTKLTNLILVDSTRGSSLPLHSACRIKSEKYTLVKSYLEKIRYEKQFDKCLIKEDECHQPILHISIENNHCNIVETLFRDYNVNSELRETITGNLPIHAAAKSGSIEMFNLLQKYDAVSFKQNKNLENALHIAAYHNRNKFINEFLKYEKFCFSEHPDSNNKYVACACRCDLDDKNRIKCIKTRDIKLYTPLLTALAASNQKCVEELIEYDEALDLTHTDINGNSMYHICAQFDNAESLKYLYLKTNINNDVSIYEIKNNFDESILHITSRNGNLEMTNYIVNKIYETNERAEEVLFCKNKSGQTCFHVAANKGFFNLCEYFVKKKKLYQFLHHVDNDLNTGLHLATMNGHQSIVGLLLDSGADANAKNADKQTALDLSCRKGYFEICKTLIDYSDFKDTSNIKGEFPIHYASQEGAHELVRTLLDKGARINQLNTKNQNALDLAIMNGHREVIRVLLNDPNWYKLIRVDNCKSYDFEEDENDFKIVIQSEETRHVKDTFVALSENKMWDIFQILVEKSRINDHEMNFSILDPMCKKISDHPLMLIARSGQENLIKHEIISLLLRLKWRFIPRFIFCFNLCFYIWYLLLFSLYTVEISSLESNNLTTTNNTGSNIFYSNQNETFYDEFDDSLITESPPVGPVKLSLYKFKGFGGFDSSLSDGKVIKGDDRSSRTESAKPESLFILLLTIIAFQLFKEVIQLLFFDGLSYIFSFQNAIEIITYSISLASLLSTDYNSQCSYGSIAVLFAYILFPIFIQKLDSIGIYVVALQRTLINSAKLFPVFLILFMGFLFSFRLRSNFGVSYSSSESLYFSLFRTITMAVGELDTSKMGLYDNDYAIPNYIIYFLFIVLMCTIVLNLFVGIAVGEIKTVLDEAQVQLHCIRIVFTLKVQSGIQPINKYFKCLRGVLHMSYKKYSFNNEPNLIKLLNELKKKIKNFIEPKEQPIHLADPQKRLEDTFIDMSRLTLDQIRSIKSVFSNQIGDIESKVINAQRRIQDTLNEFSTITLQQIYEFKNDTRNLNKTLQTELSNIQSKLNDSSGDLSYTNKYFNTRLTDTEQKFSSQVTRLESLLIDMTMKALFQFETIKQACIIEPKSIKSLIVSSEKLLEEFLVDLLRENTKYTTSSNDNLADFENKFDKLIKPCNEDLKEFIKNTFDKTLDTFRVNEPNFCMQQMQLEMMGNNLRKIFIGMILESREENKYEFLQLKKESEILNQKMEVIQTQLEEFKNILVDAINKKSNL